MSGLSGGGDKCIKVLIKRYQSGFILLPHDNVRKNQGGINSIVQQGHPAKCLLHNPPLVYHVIDLLGTLVLIDIYHKFVPPGACFPVYRAVIVAFHILLYLFELRMMPHPADTFDAQFRQVVADSKQLIPMEHQIGRIYLDIQRSIASISAGKQSHSACHKHPNPSERVNPPPRRTQMIRNRPALIRLEPHPEINIPQLECKRNLIHHFHSHRMRITALHTYVHGVFISVGEAGSTLAECPDAANAIEHHPIHQRRHRQNKKRPLPDCKEWSKDVPDTRQQDYQNKSNIESAAQSHFGTSTLSIRRCVTFTGE